MAKGEKKKLISFSQELEKAIQEDAERCIRPFARQVQAVLMSHYGIADVNLDQPLLEFPSETPPRSKK